jgi:hypothetical protein
MSKMGHKNRKARMRRAGYYISFEKRDVIISERSHFTAQGWQYASRTVTRRVKVWKSKAQLPQSRYSYNQQHQYWL